MCDILEDEWTDDDDKIHCEIIATEDGRDVDGVDEECYRVMMLFQNGRWRQITRSQTYDNSESCWRRSQ